MEGFLRPLYLRLEREGPMAPGITSCDDRLHHIESSLATSSRRGRRRGHGAWLASNGAHLGQHSGVVQYWALGNARTHNRGREHSTSWYQDW